MAYRVHVSTGAIHDMAGILLKYPNHQNTYKTTVQNAIKDLESHPRRGCSFHRIYSTDLYLNFQNIHFSESWSFEVYPIRLWYFKEDPNGSQVVGEIAVYGVQEVPPLLSSQPLNPGGTP
jgi:hypothetical protein